MKNEQSLYETPTLFTSKEKGVENYQTAGGETIAYKNVLQRNGLDGALGNKTGSVAILGKRNLFRTLAPKLKPGEFAVVERRYSRAGIFDFTTRNNMITSAADVAFIFRQLEGETVEHAFAVYIDKEKHPSVQWLSMGGVNSTIIDPRIMVDAARRLEAREIYLVHNHPSGTLIPSRPDMSILEKLKKGFGPMGISVGGIIINLNSGAYLIFDELGAITEGLGFTSHGFEKGEKQGVFCFNKQAFLQSPTNTKIQSPSDVARFLSQQRFSCGAKAGYLLLTMSNEVIGNFFATQNERNTAYQELAGLVSRFGAVNVIAYTNKADIPFYQNLKSDLHNLEINLHDVIECESSEFVARTFDKYKSLAEVGLLKEDNNNFNTYKSTIMQNQDILTGETITDPNRGAKREESYMKKNLDYLNTQIKYLGFGEGFNEALQKALESGSDKIDFPVSKEFVSPGSAEKSKAVDFILHLSKGKSTNMYFFNNYSAGLKTEGNEMNRPQTFYINKGRSFTAKEAFNLLSDRAVNKELTNKGGVTYSAWVKLKPAEEGVQNKNREFQIFSENYGFDLKETLSRYPIREMETTEASDKLMNSLKKGNLQLVTFTERGGDIPKLIEANPQYKNLTIYHEDGKKQFMAQGKSESQRSSIQQPAKEESIKVIRTAGIKR